MVGSAVIGGELVGAARVLPRRIALLVARHVLVEKHLIGVVPVSQGLRGQMRDQVLVVDHPMHSGDLGLQVGCQLVVADPGAAEVVHLHWQGGELVNEFNAVNGGQGPTQALPCAHYLGHPIELDDGLGRTEQLLLVGPVVQQEPCMDVAVLAGLVGRGFEVEVLDPVLDIGAAPPGSDEGLRGWLVAHEPHCLGHPILQVGHVDKPGLVDNRAAGPCFDAGFGAMGD